MPWHSQCVKNRRGESFAACIVLTAPAAPSQAGNSDVRVIEGGQVRGASFPQRGWEIHRINSGKLGKKPKETQRAAYATLTRREERNYRRKKHAGNHLAATKSSGRARKSLHRLLGSAGEKVVRARKIWWAGARDSPQQAGACAGRGPLGRRQLRSDPARHRLDIELFATPKQNSEWTHDADQARAWLVQGQADDEGTLSLRTKSPNYLTLECQGGENCASRLSRGKGSFRTRRGLFPLRKQGRGTTDVRILFPVAATHRDLEAEVKAGRSGPILFFPVVGGDPDSTWTARPPGSTSRDIPELAELLHAKDFQTSFAGAQLPPGRPLAIIKAEIVLVACGQKTLRQLGRGA